MKGKKYILGIDGGGTNTVGCLFTNEGYTVHSLQTKGTNLHTYKSKSISRIIGLIFDLARESKINVSDISAFGFGLSGVSDLNQREMQRMMKKAGISMDTVEGAVKVEIHLDNGQMIVINNPVINKVDVAGQTTFQVVGSDIIEQSIESEEKEVKILEEDITLVSQQTGVDIDTAKNALEMTSGDLAQAIMLLKNK